jgi:hypothetical protein
MKRCPGAILLVTKTNPPSMLHLSPADLNAIINGLDLLAVQIDMVNNKGCAPKVSNPMRRLELKIRKMIA